MCDVQELCGRDRGECEGKGDTRRLGRCKEKQGTARRPQGDTGDRKEDAGDCKEDTGDHKETARRCREMQGIK